MKSQFRMYDIVFFFGGVQLTANAQVVLQRGSEYHWNCGLGYFSSDEDLWLDLHATDACETWLVYVNCWPVCPNSEWLVVSWDIGQLYPPNKSVWSLSSQRGCKLAIDIFSFQSIQHLSARFSLGSISTYINPTKDSSFANTTCRKTLPVFFQVTGLVLWWPWRWCIW